MLDSISRLGDLTKYIPVVPIKATNILAIEFVSSEKGSGYHGVKLAKKEEKRYLHHEDLSSMGFGMVELVK